MEILLFFAFISGLVTIFAPCIWPLLPIILSSTTSGGKSKPLGITLGIIISFAFFTLTISYIVKVIPFDPNVLRLIAVIVIGFLGLTLVIPSLNQVVEGAVSRLSRRLGGVGQQQGNGFWGGFVTGFSLGIVWSPCAGPILATIATLAATQAVNFQIVLVTIAYVIGVGIPLFLFASVGSLLFNRTRGLSQYTGRIQQVFGVIMILTAIAIFTNYDKVLQTKLLDLFPSYSSFIVRLESNKAVKNQLSALRGDKEGTDQITMPFPQAENLPDYGAAPDFAGIQKWLNTDGALTIDQLKGKVVLIDFWTYTCINCIRTLPYVTSWYEKYKDKGLVVVGVHTPEFEFEKKTENVEAAMKRHSITYPVAQDNDYKTWRAYDNHYWPAKYLIDANGRIRYTHFGEGAYEETERNIQFLLKQAGKQVQKETVSVVADQAQRGTSPETYLGSQRMEFYYPKRSLSNGKHTLELEKTIPVDTFSLGGSWTISDEHAQAGEKAVLEYNFMASKVFLVLRPGAAKEKMGKVKVYLDGEVITAEKAGTDVKDGLVTITSDDLYNLVDLKGKIENHLLRLEFETPGVEAYAFTFG